MPPKRVDKDTEVTVNSSRKKAPVKATKPRIAANGHKLPERLPLGIILKDVTNQSWILGPSIGVGGFGEIYLASDNVNHPVNPDARYVIKIEPHKNGPLFTEMHFYHRVGKEETIDKWIKDHKLDYLGMPRFVSSGSLEHGGARYRFLVMDRFGEDLQKILDRNNKMFSVKNVFVLGIRIMDILEYIHSFGYIHADVKASNLLLGYGAENQNKVYLVDFGLACRYMSNDKHKEFKEDLRKAHDGTIEFTSRDAHVGAHSRRGDLEILGYNMLQWLCGQLPWENNLKDPEYVSHEKQGYMSKVPLLLQKCFINDKYPKAIMTFLQYISGLKFEEEPDYDLCRSLFKDALKKVNAKDMKLSFPPEVKTTTKRTKSPAKKAANDLTTLNYLNDNSKKPPSRARTVIATPPSSSEDDEINIKELQPKSRKETSSRKERRHAGDDVHHGVGAKKKSASSKNQKPAAVSHHAASWSSESEEEEDSANRETSSIDASTHDSSLENPTPAMLDVMKRKLEMAKASKTKKKLALNASDNYSDTYKEQVVRKYKEKSPELFGTNIIEVKKSTTTKRLPRSKMAAAAAAATDTSDRRPLATRAAMQDSPLRHYRENSYSPEI